MSFQIDRGLFRLDFTDHHAILGVPVEADLKDIRKRYLKIARRLHPDSFATEGEQDKHRANELLSKLVNPAWEKLSQERDRTEYTLLLKLKGQQAHLQQGSIELGGSLAKQLMTASNLDHFYLTSLKGLADRQYDQLDQALEMIAQISELNLVYLMRKEGSNAPTEVASRRTIFTGSNIPDSSQAPARTAAPPPPQQTRRESLADQYYRRAEEYAAKNNLAQATLELREALQVDSNHSRCHSLLGMIYLRQNQTTMAKIHFNQALKFDPENEMAIAGKQRLGSAQGSDTKATGKTGAAANPKSTPKSNNPNDKSGGGLFGLFGGKKK
ncbi:J domain-containing protein [Leptolyngbya sp. FACHB-36]|uniref:J domain-containing protein n=1 Tax=Leptolyngbya sp. FACHB-36 TaxID=2692808 RepID=UPI001680DE92|nr:J domain-containing protein [Leptolyngbya sp. FACHB-36]MBD2018676.1 J domain-containing protein [Leptolyngbya sp. FACHB-36]